MKQYNKILAGSIIAGALTLAPLAFATETTTVAPETTGTKITSPIMPRPVIKTLPATASPKAQAAVNKAKPVVKKVDPKAEAAKKNKVNPTNATIIKKMEATKGSKQAEAEAKMKAQLEEMKAKAQATTPKQ